MKSFLFGLGLGIGLGVLFAPMSGEDTRENLSERANDLANSARESYDAGPRARPARSRTGKVHRRTRDRPVAHRNQPEHLTATDARGVRRSGGPLWLAPVPCLGRLVPQKRSATSLTWFLSDMYSWPHPDSEGTT